MTIVRSYQKHLAYSWRLFFESEMEKILQVHCYFTPKCTHFTVTCMYFVRTISCVDKYSISFIIIRNAHLKGNQLRHCAAKPIVQVAIIANTSGFLHQACFDPGTNRVWVGSTTHWTAGALLTWNHVCYKKITTQSLCCTWHGNQWFRQCCLQNASHSCCFLIFCTNRSFYKIAQRSEKCVVPLAPPWRPGSYHCS